MEKLQKIFYILAATAVLALTGIPAAKAQLPPGMTVEEEDKEPEQHADTSGLDMVTLDTDQ